MGRGEDLVAIARSLAGSLYYTNESWARMHPAESGGTDCSGLCRYLYQMFGYNIGHWTGDESQAGTEIARGHYPWEIPWDIMKPGDLIFMTATYWNNYNFDQYLCHVEIYCGGGTMIGHPGGYGPQEKWAQAWMEAYGCITWKVVRIFEEDEMITDSDVSKIVSGILGYKNPNMAIRTGDIDVYQMLYNANAQLTRTDTAGHDNPNGHDMMGRIQIVEKDVREIKENQAKILDLLERLAK